MKLRILCYFNIIDLIVISLQTIQSYTGLPHYKRFSVMLARRSGAWFKNTLFVAAAKRQFNSFYTTKSV